MTKDRIAIVKDILKSYLEENGLRKTPERFSILDSIYCLNKQFTLSDLNEDLERKSFRVSRATLYNCMKLFIKLRLVVRHRFNTGTVYEPCYNMTSHCHQICTVCGKVTQVDIPEVDAALDNVKLHRFKKDGYTLYIYGICTTCQTKLSRMKAKKNQKNK